MTPLDNYQYLFKGFGKMKAKYAIFTKFLQNNIYSEKVTPASLRSRYITYFIKRTEKELLQEKSYSFLAENLKRTPIKPTYQTLYMRCCLGRKAGNNVYIPDVVHALLFGQEGRE